MFNFFKKKKKEGLRDVFKLTAEARNYYDRLHEIEEKHELHLRVVLAAISNPKLVSTWEKLGGLQYIASVPNQNIDEVVEVLSLKKAAAIQHLRVTSKFDPDEEEL